MLKPNPHRISYFLFLVFTLRKVALSDKLQKLMINELKEIYFGHFRATNVSLGAFLLNLFY